MSNNTNSTLRHIVATLCMLLLLPLAVMAQSNYTVTASKLNVRATASTNGAVVGSLSRGETIKVNRITGGWAEIQYGGRKCFVKADYLRASGNTGTTQRSTTSTRPSTSSSSSQRQSNYSSSSSRDSYSSSSTPKSGFGTCLETSFGYSNDMFIWGLGASFGFDFRKMLFIGAGPMLRGDFGDNTSFNLGGFMKARFTAPLRGKVAPMVGARLGYLYNFKSEDGGMFYGGDVGVMFNKRFGIAFQFEWAKGGGPSGGPGEGQTQPSEPTKPSEPSAPSHIRRFQPSQGGGNGQTQPSEPSKPSEPSAPDGAPSKYIFIPSLTLSLSF